MTFSAAVPLVARISSLCDFLVLTFYFFSNLWAQGNFFSPRFLYKYVGLVPAFLKASENPECARNAEANHRVIYVFYFTRFESP